MRSLFINDERKLSMRLKHNRNDACTAVSRTKILIRAVFWATRIMPLSVLSVAAWRNVIDRSHDWRGRNRFRMRRRHCTPIQSEGKRKDQGEQRLSQFGTHRKRSFMSRAPVFADCDVKHQCRLPMRLPLLPKRPDGHCNFAG
jgi:hypothetical protein